MISTPTLRKIDNWATVAQLSTAFALLAWFAFGLPGWEYVAAVAVITGGLSIGSMIALKRREATQ